MNFVDSAFNIVKNTLPHTVSLAVLILPVEYAKVVMRDLFKVMLNTKTSNNRSVSQRELRVLEHPLNILMEKIGKLLGRNRGNFVKNGENGFRAPPMSNILNTSLNNMENVV